MATACGAAQVGAPKALEITTTTESEAGLPPPTSVVEPEPETAATLPAAIGVPSTTIDAGRDAAQPVPAPSTTVPGNSVANGPLPVDVSRSVASWYGYELAGNSTANGEAFDPEGLTFAHRSMAFGTLVRFTGPLGAVVARCNDRGPFVGGRTFDLSRGAFAAVAPLSAGVASLSWEVVG